MTFNRREFLMTALALPALGFTCPRKAGGDRLGASTACIAGVPLLEAIQTIEELGFDTIELIAYTGAHHSMGLIPGFDYHDATSLHQQEVYEATRSFRHISAHMPFSDIHLLSTDSGTRQMSVNHIRQAMDSLAFLEGNMAVVHPGWPEEGMSFRDVWPQMIDTFRALGDYAGERGLKIGLETMQPDSVDDYTDLIFDVDHPAVGATVDTGHIRGASDIDLPAEKRGTAEGTDRFNDVLNRTVRSLEHKLFHVHLTDVQQSDWRDHKTIGSGIIDFERFFSSLCRIKYGGLLVFELEEPDQIGALKSSKARIESIM